MEQNTDASVPLTPMVENRQKSGNGLKIATAIACVVAICGIGFGVYGMIQSSQKDNQISDLKTQADNNNATTSEETMANIVERSETVTELQNLGFKSDNFISGATYTISDAIPGSEREIKAAFTIASPNDYVDYGFYTVDVDGRIKAQKNPYMEGPETKDITSNFSNRVIDLAIGQIGNGGISWIIALLDDGTVETLSEGDYGKETFSEKASPVYGTKDITKIYGNFTDAVKALGYAQDKEGKIHTIVRNETSADGWTFKVTD